MALYLVRHAKAGSRRDWEGDDEARPLSKAGWRQAEALADRLEQLAPPVLLSSPYLRCVQTLKPLSRRLKLKVDKADCLAEGDAFEPVLDLLAHVPDGAVLCSHGDIIPATMDALVRRGTEITTPPDWRKGSVWELQRTKEGIVSAACWPPPPDERPAKP